MKAIGVRPPGELANRRPLMRQVLSVQLLGSVLIELPWAASLSRFTNHIFWTGRIIVPIP